MARWPDGRSAKTNASIPIWARPEPGEGQIGAIGIAYSDREQKLENEFYEELNQWNRKPARPRINGTRLRF